jgi:predicted nucleic acid-binding protein
LTPIVVDASLALAWFLQDEQDSYADGVLASLQADAIAHVPAIWAYETANALTVAERRGRISENDAGRVLTLLRALPIKLEEAPRSEVIDRAIDIARRHGISAYDAAYLELAVRLDARLATLNKPLRAAAKRIGLEIA